MWLKITLTNNFQFSLWAFEATVLRLRLRQLSFAFCTMVKWWRLILNKKLCIGCSSQLCYLLKQRNKKSWNVKKNGFKRGTIDLNLMRIFICNVFGLYLHIIYIIYEQMGGVYFQDLTIFFKLCYL